MTRLAVLSDIHGNLPALQAVMADMENYEIDHVVVAGDQINWGPFSRQVMEVLYEQCWALIRGNNEFYSLDFGTSRAPELWKDYVLTSFINQQLGGKWLNIIAGLPDSLSLRFRDAPPIFVCHGIPGNPWQSISPLATADQVGMWLGDIAESTVICGHSHIPMDRHVDRWHIFNPGSVGVPLDGQFAASYMILDGDATGWTLAEYRRIPFDYEALYAEFERQNFLDYCGVQEQLIIEEFRTARLQLHPFLMWKKAMNYTQPSTQAMVDEFLTLDDIQLYIAPEYQELDGLLYVD